MRAIWLLVLTAPIAGCPDCGGGELPDDAGDGAVDGSAAGSVDAGDAGDGGSVDAGDAGLEDAGLQDAGPDPTTLTGKLLFGYQGWHLCPGDGAPPNRWVHWFRSDGGPVFDLWPDTRELDAGARCATAYVLPDGGPAYVYSAWNPATVDRHFSWMEEYGIDGVFLQRFLNELTDPKFKQFRDGVLDNVRASSAAHGRVFAVMYDLSGATAGAWLDQLKADWAERVQTQRITDSPRYLRHLGKPVMAVWGLGFADRPATTAEAQALLDWFTRDAPAAEQVTLMVGVPRSWRSDTTWEPVLKQFDLVSPWTVGSYVDEAGADSYRTRLTGDLAEARDAGFELMPVIWPGFSWHNLNAGAVNQIPRNGGRLWWRQLFNAQSLGATMVYGAMFDEVDEGTAIYKVVETAADQPAAPPFVPLDADGTALGSDFYLRLAGAGARMLRGELPLDAGLPITAP